MVNSTVILGSTGSIGRQSVAVCERLGIRVPAITTNKNVDLLLEQAAKLRPEYVAASDPDASGRLKAAFAGTDIAVGPPGEEGLRIAAAWEGAECVVTAVSGAVGLRPTLDAIAQKKRIALANKETLVCAGSIVMRQAEETGAEIVPVDSEHSAIFQCLNGRRGELRKILLTLPIQYALTWPERRASASERLDLTAMSGLHFMKPDFEKMPCLALAMDCAKRGGNAPAVMSAANEAAVGLFLNGKLGYNEIYESVVWALGRIGFLAEPSLDDIIASDGEARTLVKERYS